MFAIVLLFIVYHCLWLHLKHTLYSGWRSEFHSQPAGLIESQTWNKYVEPCATADDPSVSVVMSVILGCKCLLQKKNENVQLSGCCWNVIPNLIPSPLRKHTLLWIHIKLQNSVFVLLDASNRQWLITQVTSSLSSPHSNSQFPEEPTLFSLRVIYVNAVLTLRWGLLNGQLELLCQAEPCCDPELQAHTRACGLKHPLRWHNLAQSFARTSIVCL